MSVLLNTDLPAPKPSTNHGQSSASFSLIEDRRIRLSVIYYIIVPFLVLIVNREIALKNFASAATGR